MIIYCPGTLKLISESPASVTVKIETRKYLPQAVPKSMLPKRLRINKYMFKNKIEIMMINHVLPL